MSIDWDSPNLDPELPDSQTSGEPGADDEDNIGGGVSVAERAMVSVAAAIMGFLLLIGSVALLYWNEGRAVKAHQSLDAGASRVVEAVAGASLDGKLAHLTGVVDPARGLADPSFGVSVPSALRLTRKVEMLQWSESHNLVPTPEESGSKKSNYSYEKKWSETPINSSGFQRVAGHENPSMPMSTATIDNAAASVSGYKLDAPMFKKMTGFRPVAIDPSAKVPAGFRAQGSSYFYAGRGSMAAPQVGDLRVSFLAVPAETYSFVGGVWGQTLTGYVGEDKYEIALAVPGVAPAERMFERAHVEESAKTWMLRGLGLLLTFVAFFLMAAPVTALFAFIPILEDIAGTAAAIVAFIAAAPTTFLVVSLAWMAHRPLVGMGLLALAAGSFFALAKWRPAPKPKAKRQARAGLFVKA